MTNEDLIAENDRLAKVAGKLADENKELRKHNEDLRKNKLENDEANFNQCAKLVDERDVLRKQVAERDALLVEMREALKQSIECLHDIATGQGGWAWEEVISQSQDALSKTLPSEALERALKAEREKIEKAVDDAHDTGDAGSIERDVYMWNKAVDYCLRRIRSMK